MYGQEWRGLPECRFLDWPPYRGEPGLAEIAARVVADFGIESGSIVVGHSLGGMVACEMARLREIKVLVLISSARKPEEVGRMARLLSPLAPIAPLRFLQRLAAGLTSETARMFCRSDPEFIRATSQAVFQWQGFAGNQVPLKRIHGTRDPIIPLPPDVDLVLNGGHLIPKTHAAECVAFIRSLM
jgi:pimeloyl-ACP methyl ester carboxylesterase